MLVYWSLLAWTTFVGLTWKKWFINKKSVLDNGEVRLIPTLVSMMFSMLPMIFIIGMRTAVADTVNYIESFNNLTPTFSAMLKIRNKDKLFYQFATLIKMIIPNSNAWLTITAFFQVLFICVTVKRYSAMPGVSLFLFVASVEIAYMFNGMRQFVAVTLLFAGYRLLVEKKYVAYILLIVLAAQFHGTAYVMIIGLLFSFIRPWSKAMYLIIVGLTFTMIFIDPLLSGMQIFFEDSEYSRQMAELMQTEGVNVIRAFVALVPIALGFAFRNNRVLFSKREYAVAFNMSMLNAVFFIAASIVGGNLMARFAEYFTIYQLLTYPALFKCCFKAGKERSVIVLAFGAFYCVWFWYQMDVNWQMTYISDVLGWYY
ncbi:MAG: EpsG family protein [Oscillospiraceae bacterium]|nr:EpsG family protein [Oscillospiraceae bacterium]